MLIKRKLTDDKLAYMQFVIYDSSSRQFEEVAFINYCLVYFIEILAHILLKNKRDSFSNKGN